ncbi:MAG: sulfite exporter TauE/SafE family protein [Paludibacterium sp.]|uniref:sulfite exporter TauE/SafE family protein n=1 Tax=Paludibacterium sp. TaxID=1917523 RepID=UPI0025CF2197|nr:sulfite exporter TauE/SafE family protein [Paludibacterium sp.]MBV8048851.1 sulfite exporter TauE/SafE family protein [Paludibacterium sp.]MBV8646492.1 sulfite exporter TauE/SafE family protein [Paludibacterium sp.]
MIETSLMVIFLAGLLGGGHCIGMCGGIVAALTLPLPRDKSRFVMLLGFNAGRLASYTLIGTLLGGLAGAALLRAHPLQLGLYLLADLMIIAIGLYLAGLSAFVTRIERLGQPVWRRLQPLARRLLPIRHPGQAVMAGALWGWVPCGLVYSAGLSALASGHALDGALVMLCFGLGTLPNLLAMGLFAEALKTKLQQKAVRTVAGLAVAALGAAQLARLLF